MMKKHLIVLQLCALTLMSGCAVDATNKVADAPIVSTNTAPAKTETLPPISPKIYLIPTWVRTIQTGNINQSLVCMRYQLRYKFELLESILELHEYLPRYKKTGFTKQNYYAFASYLGYISDNPIERDEIVQKLKAKIDHDFNEMVDAVDNADYLLFVGDMGGYIDNGPGSWTNHHWEVSLPYLVKGLHEDGYDWTSNSFRVKANARYSNYSPTGYSYGNGYVDIGQMEGKYTVSSKGWEEGYKLDFSEAQNVFSAVMLVNKKNFYPVYGEIRSRASGRTVLALTNNVISLTNKAPTTKLTAEDYKVISDSEAAALSKLIPNIPYTTTFNNCDGLSPRVKELNTPPDTNPLKAILHNFTGGIAYQDVTKKLTTCWISTKSGAPTLP